jgi:hypothetical protein
VSRRDEYIAATRAGRAAQVGDRNPYRGQGVLADLWMRGYEAMLNQWIADTPTRQATLRAQSETPRP